MYILNISYILKIKKIFLNYLIYIYYFHLFNQVNFYLFLYIFFLSYTPLMCGGDLKAQLLNLTNSISCRVSKGRSGTNQT